MRLTLLLSLCSLLLAPLALGQPWTHGQGPASLSLGIDVVSADQRYAADRTVVVYDERLPDGAGAHYRAREFFLKGEFGLLEQLTVSARLPLRQVTVLSLAQVDVQEREEVDLGDATLQALMALGQRVGLPDSWELGVGLGLKLPLGYRRNVVPAVGSGQVDADLLASIGREMLGGDARAHLDAGYRFRSGIYALSRQADCPAELAPDDRWCFREQEQLRYGDQVLLATEISYTALGRLHLHGSSTMEWSLRKPEAPSRRGGVFLPEWFTEQRVARLGGGLMASLFDELDLMVAFETPVYGRNAVTGTRVIGALRVNL